MPRFVSQLLSRFRDFDVVKITTSLQERTHDACRITNADSSPENVVSAQPWSTIDLYNVFQNFYEVVGAANANVGSHALFSFRASRQEAADALSTADLTTRVAKLVHYKGAARFTVRCEGKSSEASPRATTTTVATYFAEQLRGLITAQEHILHTLVANIESQRSRCLDELVSAASDTVRRTSVTTPHTLWHRFVRPDWTPLPSASRQEEEQEAHSISVNAGVGITVARVLSSNLYTITAFLDAWRTVTAADCQVDGALRIASTLSGEQVLPLFFYLITLSLNLAAAAPAASAAVLACCGDGGRDATSPHALTHLHSSLRGVVQLDGSLLLERLLRLAGENDRISGDSGCTNESDATTHMRVCHSVVTQHLLRRLGPLLFTPLMVVNEKGEGVTESDNTGCAQRQRGECAWWDSTRVELVIWVADTLRSLYGQPAADQKKGNRSTDLRTNAFSLRGCRAGGATTSTWLDELLRRLINHAEATLKYADDVVASERTAWFADADLGPVMRPTVMTASATRVAEYASILSPAFRNVRGCDGDAAMPPSLRERFARAEDLLRLVEKKWRDGANL